MTLQAVGRRAGKEPAGRKIGKHLPVRMGGEIPVGRRPEPLKERWNRDNDRTEIEKRGKLCWNFVCWDAGV